MVAQIDKAYRATGLANVAARLVSYGLFEGRPLTTRGQWFNPAVERWLGVVARRSSGSAPRQPIFIVGLGRSGTTLLGQLLSVHPDVGWLNEPKLMWHLAHPEEDLIGSYAEDRLTRVRMDAGDVRPGVAERARAMTSGYLATVRRSRLVDKYPELIYRLDFVRRIYPDASFVALQRRADASATSIVTWGEAHGDGLDDWWGRDGRKWRLLHRDLMASDELLGSLLSAEPAENDPLAMAVAEWLLTAEEVARVLDAPDVTLVRYEDLVADPTGTLRALCDATGLAHSSQMEAYAREACQPGRVPTPLDGRVPDPLLQRVRAAEAALGYGKDS